MYERRLLDIFESFSSFGSGSINNLTGIDVQMDGARFAKFAKDSKIVDKRVTTTDVDIIFKKVKGKTERKINFEQFKEALQLIAKIKYPQYKDNYVAYQELVHLVTSTEGPMLSGNVTVPEASKVVERMTDTSLYTGLHKYRAADGEAIKMKRASSAEKLAPSFKPASVVNQSNEFERGLKGKIKDLSFILAVSQSNLSSNSMTNLSKTSSKSNTNLKTSLGSNASLSNVRLIHCSNLEN
jgi:hypothetical protein